MPPLALVVEQEYPEMIDNVYHLIQELHSLDFQDSLSLDLLGQKCRKFAQSCHEASEQLAHYADELSKTFRILAERLGHFPQLFDGRPLNSKEISKKEIKEAWKKLAEQYEYTVRQFGKTKAFQKSGKSFKHLKPVNYYRNLYHAMNAFVAVGLYQYVLTQSQALWILIPLSLTAIAIEITRRYSNSVNNFMVNKVFRQVMRPCEKFKINSATYYLLSTTAMCALISRPVFLTSLLILGLGDPAANIIGKRFGSTKIHGQKSLQGSMAFLLSAFLVAFLGNHFVFAPQIMLGKLFFFSSAVAMTGTLVELFSGKLDDNMTIIISCSLIGSLLM